MVVVFTGGEGRFRETVGNGRQEDKHQTLQSASTPGFQSSKRGPGPMEGNIFEKLSRSNRVMEQYLSIWKKS